MSEEEPKPASPLTTGPSDEGADEGASPAPAADAGVPPAPAEPVNKVHEWAAAAAIVVFLTIVLAGFVFFMRGASI